MSDAMPAANVARYWTDAGYKRDVDRANAWQNIARQFDAVQYRMRVRAWLTGSQIGDSDSAGRYIVTDRTLGALTLTLADGETRAMFAPVPLA